MNISWDEIKAYKYLKDNNSIFMNNIDRIIAYAENVLPYINRVFDNYTSHGIEHSKMVIKYMSDLIDDMDKLSELEITILIYCGLLHDIGMVVIEDEIELIKSNKFELTDFKYERVFDKVNNEKLALQEIIRPIHGKKSKVDIINMVNNSDLKQCFCIPNRTNNYFIEEVANICMAHNEEFEWIKLNLSDDNIKGEYRLNSQYIALLLRIADLLDIDETRTPLYLYCLLNPKGISDMEWKQHFIIENNEKIVNDERLKIKVVRFYGESKEANIHRKILKYIDYINNELLNATSLSEKMKDSRYYLKIKPVVDNKIRTKTFSFSDFKLSLDYGAVTKLLMGENIYGDKKYGLREIIQNSIDACKLMKEESSNIEQYRRMNYEPYIRVEIDKDRNKIVIADNGIGMSLDILKKYFFNVGISYYSADEYKYKGYDYEPIGNYGIGFLACFMLSNKVSVITKRFNENKVNYIDIEKQSEYICLTQKDDVRMHGTEIILEYSQVLDVFKDIKSIKYFIDNNFIDNNIPISIIELKNSEAEQLKCSPVKIKEENQGTIRLDKYLNGISGYMDIKYKNILFIKSMYEISGQNSYIYNENLYGRREIILEDDIEDIKISKYINNNEIAYITLPIINCLIEDEFENAYSLLEDYDSALNKIDNVDFVSIFFDEKDTSYNDNEILDTYENIIGDFSVLDFSEKFGHSKNVLLQLNYNSQKIIDIGLDEFLCYREDNKKLLNYYGHFYTNKVKEIFLRDVLLPKCGLEIPFLIEGINIEGFIFNITNKKAVPNVSRTDIGTDVLEEISYAIGKALHLWIYNNVDLSYKQKELVKKFIDINYYKSNEFLKV